MRCRRMKAGFAKSPNVRKGFLLGRLRKEAERLLSLELRRISVSLITVPEFHGIAKTQPICNLIVAHEFLLITLKYFMLTLSNVLVTFQ